MEPNKFPTQDYINIICVNSKFKETTEKLRFNPIPINSLKLFPKIQTQYLYDESDIKIDGIDNYEVWYVVDYSKYLKFKENNVKFHFIVFTENNRNKYGKIIPKVVNILGDNCLHEQHFGNSERIPRDSHSFFHTHEEPYSYEEIDEEPYSYTEIDEKSDEKIDYGSDEESDELIGGKSDNKINEVINEELGGESDEEINYGSDEEIDYYDNYVEENDYMEIKESEITSVNIPGSISALIVFNCDPRSIHNMTEYPTPKNNTVVFQNNLGSGSDCTVGNFKFPKDIFLIYKYQKEFKLKTIPNNIISLKNNILPDRHENIVIPTSVTYLCNDCFKNYKKLKSITIPTTVKHIGKHLIDGCISLTQLNYDGDWNNIVVSYDDHLKFKTKGLIFNSIEYNKKDIMKYGTNIPLIVHSLHHSYYIRQDKNICIPTHITSLDKNMFSSTYTNIFNKDYSQLKSIVIPTSITTLPKYCFSKCSSLTKVELPTTIISIKKYAFSNCISLQSIIIPPSVYSIEKYSFKHCYSLTSISLPSPLPTFGEKCFKECYQLKDNSNIPNAYF
ncbi:hypothetical protein QTN25_002219 [Entamoeba marina]